MNGTARCAVIFLTGHGDVTQTVEQIKLAAVDFLSKPLATAPLTAALQQGGAPNSLLVNTKYKQRYASLPPQEQIIAPWG